MIPLVLISKVLSACVWPLNDHSVAQSYSRPSYTELYYSLFPLVRGGVRGVWGLLVVADHHVLVRGPGWAGGPRAVRGLDSTLSFYRGDWTGHARPAGRHTWILILRPGDHHTINHHHHNTFSFIYTSEWLCEECKVIAIKHFTAYHLGYSPSVSSYWMLTNDAGLFPIEISHQSAVTWNMKHSHNFLTLFAPRQRFS